MASTGTDEIGAAVAGVGIDPGATDPSAFGCGKGVGRARKEFEPARYAT